MTKEVLDLLTKNISFCLLCLREYHNVSLYHSACGHLVCKDCWSDIEWIDARQHLVLDYLNKSNFQEDTKSETKEDLQDTPNKEEKRRGSPSRKKHSENSDTKMNNSTEFIEKKFSTRLSLLFRCPICEEFLKDRLIDYVSADISLSKAAERSARIQGVLSEVDRGDVTLHKHISSKELTNLEPIVEGVYKGKYGNQTVAVKYFKPYFIGFDWSRFRREVAILGVCHHPNIISFIGAYAPDTKDINTSNWQDENSLIKPFIVSEYLPETLSNIIKNSNKTLHMANTLRYSTQISLAVQFLHSMNIVHRDIKPANVVITSDGSTAKLIDFGESRIVNGTGLNEPLTVVGTPFYEAPEIVNGIYTDKVDSFSMGKMFYEMIAKSLNPSILGNRLFYEGPLDATYINGCPQEIIEVIMACVQTSYFSRPDFDFITKQLRDIENKFQLIDKLNTTNT